MSVRLNPIFLMYAFRYALGRQGYPVRDVADALLANRYDLRREWREQIVERIREAIDMGNAGSPYDVEVWRRVADILADPPEPGTRTVAISEAQRVQIEEDAEEIRAAVDADAFQVDSTVTHIYHDDAARVVFTLARRYLPDGSPE